VVKHSEKPADDNGGRKTRLDSSIKETPTFAASAELGR
jgi:hypothetical protein